MRNILASIRSGRNHITCATNQENNAYFCFCFTDCEIQEQIILVLQLFVEKEIHMHIEIKLEKPPHFEGDQAKHRVSKQTNAPFGFI